MKQAEKEERKRETKPEDMMKQVQKVFQERGSKALEIARKEILQEKIECKEAREALTYFMTEYWHDVARPALLSLVCEAVGGNPEITTPIAVPMILLSGAVDIHDDIIDQSEKKESRLTVYGKFGKNIALLAGDALVFKGFALLHRAGREIPSGKISKIIDVIKDTFFELGDAEALELQLQGKFDISPKEYLHIIEKRAANVEAHTRIGGILGGGTEGEIESLGRYGRALGMLLIMQDDFLDMFDPEELSHRIRFECPPLQLLYALRNSEIREKIKVLLSKRKMTKLDAKALIANICKTREFNEFKATVQKLGEIAYSQLNRLKYRGLALKLIISTLIATIA